MPELDINGLSVKFPYDESYPVQRLYMEKVINSLNNRENAILESPSGTGKTLALLCATMAWRENRKKEHKQCNIPIVIYASRTHSQVAHAMKELKKSAYNEMKAIVIGSRNQFCIHPELKAKSNSDKIYLCKSLVRKSEREDSEESDEANGTQETKGCIHYEKIDLHLNEPELKEKIIDIEDLHLIGQKYDCCPYFVSKKIAKSADIIFMPYNYLIDPRLRDAIFDDNQIDLKNAIIILDEAHNVNVVCEQSASTFIKSSHIRKAIAELNYVIEKCVDRSTKAHNLLGSIQTLKREINKMQSDASPLPGSYMFTLLMKAKITRMNYESHIDFLDGLIPYLLKKSEGNSEENSEWPKGTGLKAFSEFIQVVFIHSNEKQEKLDDCFKVYVESVDEKEKKENNDSDKDSKIVNFRCFSPAFGMKHLNGQGGRCIILTSSTLSPLEPLITEFEIPFPIKLINPHIIKNFQIFASIVRKGADDTELESQLYNRRNENYLMSLGNTIVELTKVVPNGMLVFFPSYELMDLCKEFFERKHIWEEIQQEKQIFYELQSNDQFQVMLNDYYKTVDENKGAILMAVLRGKFSEGLDFADNYGRAVVVVGVPFAPSKDPKVVFKKDYHQRNGRDGDEWYVSDAIRATNQAIGRVIRHKNDYAAIFLCDNRFFFRSNKKYIAHWLQCHLKKDAYISFPTTISQVKKFFKNAKEKVPAPEQRSDQIEYNNDEYEYTPQYKFTPRPIIQHGISDSDDDDESTSNEESSHESSSAGSSTISNNKTVKKRRINRFSSSSASDGSSEMPDETIPGPSSRSNKLSDSDESEEIGPKRIRRNRKKAEFPDSDSSQTMSQNDATEIKNPILQFIKADLRSDQYTKVLQIFTKYNKDGDYESYRNSLFDIFPDQRWFDNLKGMILFTKLNDRATFEADVEEFIRSRSQNINNTSGA